MSRRTTISCRCIARIPTVELLLILSALALATSAAARQLSRHRGMGRAELGAALRRSRLGWHLGGRAAGTGAIAAHSLRDGALLWSTELRAEQSLAADADRVYVASGEAIHALNAADGRVAWRAPAGARLTAPPLAHGGWVIAAAAGDLIAIRASDGTLVWRKHVGPVEFRPSIDGELLVASIVDGHIVALDVRDGTELWRTRVGASPGEAVVLGGRVYCRYEGSHLLLAARVVWPRRRIT